MPSPLTRLRDREFYSPPSEPPRDRFIPTRALLDLDLARDSLLHAGRQDPPPTTTTTSPGVGREHYRRWVEENLRAAGANGKPFRMLPFRSPRKGEACRRSLRLVDEMLKEAKELDSVPLRRPCIPKYPVRVLDAPGMADDFYLNLMDWGKENMLAMALGSDVYLKKEHGESVQNVPRSDRGRSVFPTSVAWSGDGKRLAVGRADSQIDVWDIHAMHHVQELSHNRFKFRV